MFAFCSLSIGVLAGAAVFTDAPMVFPSLGPTALLFICYPHLEATRPRNVLCGHAIALACGYSALVLTGLEEAPSTIIHGVDLPRVLAAAVSIGATGAFMVLLNVVHAPAGATTLIVSLGFITRPTHLGVIEIAVALLTLEAFLFHRIRHATVAPDSPRE